jgi:hypothetical protein
MRSLEEKLVGDEKRKRELSLAAGGRRSRDPRWTAEEGLMMVNLGAKQSHDHGD